MKKLKYVWLVIVPFIISSMLMTKDTFSQDRLYLRFSDNTDTYPLCGATGLRIRHDYSGNNYWVLGYSEDALGRHDALALVSPGSPPTEVHAHYTMTMNPGWAYSEDMVVNANTDVALAGHVRITGPTRNDMSLGTVATNLAPTSSKQLYSMTDRYNLGKAIYYDGTNYIIAFDSQDLTTPGRIETGVCSINATTFIPNWWVVFTNPTYTGLWDEVKDITRNPVSGNYAIVGNRMSGTGIHYGMITEVTAAGALVFQQYLKPTYKIDFNSISCFSTLNGQEYIVSGTYYLNTPQLAVFVGSFAPATLTRNWAYWYRSTTSSENAYGFRHTSNTYDGSIVVAGMLTHNSGYSSGTLLKIKNKTYNDTDCDGLYDKWMSYDTYDPVNSELASTVLVDVVRKIGASSGEELAAVGTAFVNHQYQDYDPGPPEILPAYTLFQDVLWIDTDASMESHNGGNTPYTDDCTDIEIDHDCYPIEFEYADTTRNELDEFDQSFEDVDENDDQPNRLCGELDENDRAKQGSEFSDKVRANVSDIASVSPVPNEGAAGTLHFGLSTSSELNANLYNEQGVKVQSVVSGVFNNGYHKFDFDCSSLSSGMYALRVECATFIKTILVPVIR